MGTMSALNDMSTLRAKSTNDMSTSRDTSTTGEADSPEGPRRRTPTSSALALALLGVATIGLNQYRLGDWVISDLVFVGSAAAVGLMVLTGNTGQLAKGELRRIPPMFILGSILLLTGATVSSFGSLDPLGSMQVVARLTWVTIIWFWLLGVITPDRAALGKLTSAFKLTILISSVAAILGNLGVVDLDAIDNNRQTAFFFHPNQLATCLIIGLPFFLVDVAPAGRRRSRDSMVRRLALIGLVVVALGTTGSMTGASAAILGAAVTLSLLFMTRDPNRRRRHPLTVMAVILVLALGAGSLVQSNAQVVERFTLWRSGDSGTSSSVESRGNFNAAVMERFDQRMVVGVGLDRTSNYFEFGDLHGMNHNMYLLFLNGAGLPALVGLLVMLLIVLHHGWRLVLNTRGTSLHTTAIAAVGAVVGAMYITLFQPSGYERYFWFPILLIGVLWQLRRQELHDAALRAGEPLDQPGPVSAETSASHGNGSKPIRPRSSGMRDSRP